MKIDTHAHIFLKSLKMAEDSRYTPDYDCSYEDYMSVLDRHGFERCVLVQPSFLGYENDYMLDSIKGSKHRAIVVVPSNISFESLRDLQKRGACGIRLNLLGKEIPDFREYENLFVSLKNLNMQVEIQRDMRDLHKVLEAIVPFDCEIMIDHLGRGNDSREGLADLLKYSGNKIYFKVSGFYRADSKENLIFAKEMYEILSRHFGVENFVFGSDYPFTNFESAMSYERVLEAFSFIVENSKDREAMLGENAMRIFFRG